MKVIYLGSSGALSYAPLCLLISARVNVVAVGLEASNIGEPGDSKFPITMEQKKSVQTLAHIHNIPVIPLSMPPSEYCSRFKIFSPDVILVSCFSRILEESTLSLPRLGCFNLHPSLLPKYRGPAPLYWQERDGITTYGVTLHRMSVQIDAGPIVGQSTIDRQENYSEKATVKELSEKGGILMLSLLDDLNNQTLTESPQKDLNSTYQGYPQDSSGQEKASI